MAFSEPKPGLVINYSFLWPHEADRGQDEGIKDRPCAIIVATEKEDGDRDILVVPITHTEPDPSRGAIALPPATMSRLGLGNDPSWIITDSLNRFVWPGPDIRPLRTGDIAYGTLPKALTVQVREAVIAHSQAHTKHTVEREE